MKQAKERETRYKSQIQEQQKRLEVLGSEEEKLRAQLREKEYLPEVQEQIAKTTAGTPPHLQAATGPEGLDEKGNQARSHRTVDMTAWRDHPTLDT